MHDPHPSYFRVFGAFAANSLIRDMTFRANFLIDCLTSVTWMGMNLGFYLIVFRFTPEIGQHTGWEKYHFFGFIATTSIINALVQAFFMPNADELSELIRTGNLDFALLKPIDTQFLVSLSRVEWSSLSNLVFGVALLSFSLWKLGQPPTVVQAGLYVLYVLCGVAILYSLTITMSAASVWLGRNQNLYDFWFYITNFSRYPREIYRGRFGDPLRIFFTFAIPVLLVVNVPARIVMRPLSVASPSDTWLPLFALAATAASLVISRWVFQRALQSYRSASS